MVVLEKWQRAFLANQHRILNLLGDESREHTKLAEAYESGVTTDYFHRIDDEIPSEVFQEVRDMISMFRLLRKAMERLESEGTEVPTDVRRFLTFKGFDTHNDTRHYELAQYFEQIGDFPDMNIGRKAGGTAYLHNYQALLAAFTPRLDVYLYGKPALEDLEILADAAAPSGLSRP